jgi:hypothetical protein
LFNVLDVVAPLAAPCLTPLFFLLLSFNALDVVVLFTILYFSFVNVIVFLVVICLSLFNVVAPLVIPCSMLLLLLLLFAQRYCFSCCSLLDLVGIVAPYSMHLTLLLLLFAKVPLYYVVMLFFLLLLVACLILLFLFLLFWISISSLSFCKCGRSCPNSSFEARPKKRYLFFQFLFVDEFFNYPCCF